MNNSYKNHPLIVSNNDYLFEKKFVSISSEHRDLTKYPSSSCFEIELPQDYVNVQSIKLVEWHCHFCNPINNDFYMAIDGLNCIDIATIKGGVVNFAFAKLCLQPITVYQCEIPYKWFYPPAERIRKLKITCKYGDGTIVDFGITPFSFMLEFNLLNPQIIKKQNISFMNGT